MNDAARPAMLRGIDKAAFAVALTSRLRAHGMCAGLTGVADFILALRASPPDGRSRVYWAARLTLVRRHSELAAFDAVFASVFDDAVLGVDPHARRTLTAGTFSADDTLASVPGAAPDEQAGAGLPWLTLPPVVAGAEDSDSALAVPQRLPSEVAALAEVPFERLSSAEMQLLGRWLESAMRGWPTRRSRRYAVGPGGRRIAIRPTIARSRRTGWEPIHLVRVTPIDRPRRVVMLCDVSQSMQAQASAYFHLMRALALSVDAEVFAFATMLTRLTTVLAHRSADTAIELATAKVVDRFGGTQIASNLQRLLASHHGGLLRGAVVIVASDGWDSDSPQQLASAMARLRRRAYRVIWMNPRAGAPGFEPQVATMAAALPHCDALVPADNFRALAGVIAQVARCGSPATTTGSASFTRPVSSTRTANSTRSRESRVGTGQR